MRTVQNNKQGSVLLVVAAGLFVGSGGLVAAHYLTLDGAQAEASVATQTAAVSEPDAEPVRREAPANVADFLGFEVTVVIGDASVAMPWSELGVIAATDSPSEHSVPVTVDREATLARVRALKATHDIFPIDARLDLGGRKVLEGGPGLAIDAFGSVGRIETAARSGASRVELPVVQVPQRVTVADLGIEDISQLLATFTTKFSIMEKTRNHNLKLAASKLNGHVLQPGEPFSFNDVVGARGEEEGYKIAHVITAGQMVDGLAGGTCQISTTLHGAAFFAGLEIVKSTPHSRPSTYVHMGLDATVVWPNTDLKLRNAYEFPVVIHYRVTRGESVVEILGKARPYDKISFEREVAEEIEFDMVTREDDEMPVGSMTIDQYGFPGYKMVRYRKYYKKGRVVKQDKWKLSYRPVTEYARTGINPDPNLPQPKPSKRHGPKPPKNARFKLTR